MIFLAKEPGTPRNRAQCQTDGFVGYAPAQRDQGVTGTPPRDGAQCQRAPSDFSLLCLLSRSEASYRRNPAQCQRALSATSWCSAPALQDRGVTETAVRSRSVSEDSGRKNSVAHLHCKSKEAAGAAEGSVDGVAMGAAEGSAVCDAVGTADALQSVTLWARPTPCSL
jgi:hypothetical protein